jgi:hypothetical protein
MRQRTVTLSGGGTVMVVRMVICSCYWRACRRRFFIRSGRQTTSHRLLFTGVGSSCSLIDVMDSFERIC